MPKPSFTPGPWRLYRPEGFAILSEDAIIGVAHRGKERAAIDTRVISEDEANANARLISAAPELLEALKEIEWSDCGRCPQCGRFPRTKHQPECVVGLAIARAEGGQS